MFCENDRPPKISSRGLLRSGNLQPRVGFLRGVGSAMALSFRRSAATKLPPDLCVSGNGRCTEFYISRSREPFREGVAAVSRCDEAFFIDKAGRTSISGGFRYASSFSGGLAHFETMTASGLLEG